MLQLIPAIDLLDGRCVRLYQGRFEQQTHYDLDPVELAVRYRRAGARWLHVVDLDGARTGKPGNSATIRRILDATDLKVQVGGGIRDAAALETLFAAGAARVVIGSSALTAAPMVLEWLSHYGGERLALALDVRIVGESVEVVTHGWTQGSQRELWDVLKPYADRGLEHILCTDVARDGALAGPNLDLYAKLCAAFPALAVQASGGVRDTDDLAALADVGAAAAISGRALLDGRMRLADLSVYLPDAGESVGSAVSRPGDFAAGPQRLPGER